jgi:NADPH:quinone reductase-like Zn-dependent oxidoreductase
MALNISISSQETPMTLAVQIDQPGGPEELKLVDVTVGDPGPGEIRIRHKAIGLNFIDVYQRSGPLPLRHAAESWAWKAPASWRPWARASRT